MNKIAIAGATGYLGKHIVHQVIKQNLEGLALVINLEKLDGFESETLQKTKAEFTKPKTLKVFSKRRYNNLYGWNHPPERRFDKVPLLTKSKQHIYENDSLLYIVSSNAPLRAEKGTVYEGGIREPFIVKWLSEINPRQVSEALISSVDFYPTFMALAGGNLPEGQIFDGKNIMPELLGNNDEPRRSLFWHYPFNVIYNNPYDGLSEDNTNLYYVSKNLDKKETFSTMLAFSIKVNDWWNMRYNLNWVYQALTTIYEEELLKRNKNNFNFNSVQSINLSNRISAEFAGFYRSRSYDGVSIYKASGKMDIGIQMKFKNEKSKLNFNVSDVFKTNVMRFESNIPELNIFTDEMYDMEPRVARLTFTHNFGNTSVKSARERNTASEEERKRVRN